MLRDEFEEGYCRRSGISVESYRQNLVSLPCGCGDSTCAGWAAVSIRDAHSLLYHLWRDLPDAEALRAMHDAELKGSMLREGIDGNRSGEPK